MNEYLLNIEVQEFINTNLNSDISSLLLKGTSFSKVEAKEIIEQIEAKKKCKTKLPTWFNTKNIYYPNKLNIEQTSSEITAQYKSRLLKGNSIIDLTGGFGVDSYYFLNQFKEVTHCELDKKLSKIVKHNFEVFNFKSITTLTTDGLQYLMDNKKNYDWIYLDPSRRHESKGKVFFLKDCLPNVPEVIDQFFERSNNIMIKTSPLLDISVGMGELKYVKEIQVVAVENEVKELIWILELNSKSPIKITAINLKESQNECFTFHLIDEVNAGSSFSEPLTYLFEPNAAILKSGAFKSVSANLGVFKLHANTHLYTHNNLIDFPGRHFKIEKVLPYSKSILKSGLPRKANITTRNFPEPVLQLRKKFKIADGGSSYLFFTTNMNNEKIVLICSKLTN